MSAIPNQWQRFAPWLGNMPGWREEGFWQYENEELDRIAAECFWVPLFTYAKYYAFSKDLDFVPTSDEIPQFYAAKWK